MIIVNADDWGRSQPETDAALECFRRGTVTSATAMVFMADSERAARIAKEAGISVGLHLNLSERFTGTRCSPEVSKQHERIVRFLKLNKYALLLYNPVLRSAFNLVYRAQFDEFVRLYGQAPSHVDGHQHMHLCSNMLIDPPIESGTKVRRSFSFWSGEKSSVNRWYRRLVDRTLARRYRITDYFFALSRTFEPEPMARLVKLASVANVELETHPVVPREKALLMSEDFCKSLGLVQKGSYASL
jgi:chitin disaccharide deacetylase